MAVTLFTAMAAATLVPPVARFLGRPLQLVVWAGFIATSTLRVVGVPDPKVSEATASLAWAAGEIFDMQVTPIRLAVQAWIVDNRFGIAQVVIAAAALDAFVLALIRSHRAAHRARLVHLGEWFVLAAPAAAALPDPLEAADRKIAAGARAVLQAVAASTVTRTLVVKPFARAVAHVLGPGPARLHAVKVALGVEDHDAQPAGSDPARSVESAKPAARNLGASYRLWAMRSTERPNPGHGRRRGWPASAGPAVNVGSPRSGALGGSPKHGRPGTPGETTLNNAKLRQPSGRVAS